MNLNKAASINSLLKEASRMAGDLKFGKNNQEGHTEIDLLSVLFQIQSLVISIRAERFLEQLVTEKPQLAIKSSPDEKSAAII